MKQIKMVKTGVVGGYDFAGTSARCVPLLGYIDEALGREVRVFFRSIDIGAPVRVTVTAEVLGDLVEVTDTEPGPGGGA